MHPAKIAVQPAVAPDASRELRSRGAQVNAFSLARQAVARIVMGEPTDNLRRCVQALAQPFEEQVALYPAFVMVTDELALDFEEAMIAFRPSRTTLAREQDQALDALDSRITQLSGPQNGEFWQLEALRSDPRWDELRTLAATVLAAFGWPSENPAKNGGIYVNARSVTRNK